MNLFDGMNLFKTDVSMNWERKRFDSSSTDMTIIMIESLIFTINQLIMHENMLEISKFSVFFCFSAILRTKSEKEQK